MALPAGLRALDERDFRVYYAGNLVAQIGAWMQTVSQSWLVLELTGSPLRLGLVSTLQFGPILLLSVFTGVLADRVTRRHILVTAQALQGVLALSLGLLVWSGRHAWVMSGFRATADPAFTDDFEVTHVYIEDPWAGRTSPAWGRGLAPHSLVRANRLSGFTRWSSSHRPEYGRDGHYVIVAPLIEGMGDGLAAVATGLAPAA